MFKSKPKAIFIIGPTASEKTKLAIELKKKINIEIISVDSTLIYRGMNIGTAKPTKNEMKLAPHRLIDILDPSQYYSVAHFRKDALLEMKKITSLGKIPLLVGGSMLYFKSLLDGLSNLPSANFKIRSEIKEIVQKFGLNLLYKKLKKIDLESARKIHPNDFRRLSRALEIFLISGKKPTELKKKKSKIFYNILQLIILPKDRQELNKKIKFRFLKMLKQGFEEEFSILYKRKDLNKNLPSMQSIGYKQMWSYFSGKINYNEMVEQSIYATYQLAKKQLTWLKKWNGGHKIFFFDIQKIVDKISYFIEN